MQLNIGKSIFGSGVSENVVLGFLLNEFNLVFIFLFFIRS